MDLLYNFLMLALVGGALTLLRHRRTGLFFLSAGGALLLGASLLAFVLGLNFFARARLLAYGTFLHLPLFLLASAALLWSSVRKSALAGAAAAILVLAAGADAFLIEPERLHVSHFNVISSKLSSPLKIAVLADLQTDVIGDYERRVFRRALEEKPDLILMPGDFIQEADTPKRARLQEELRRFLQEIRFSAPLGIHAAEGNIDNSDWPDAFTGLPVTLYKTTRSEDRGEIQITGLSLKDSFNVALSLRSADRFHLVFGHAPNFARGAGDADLLVAGHTHGGQIRLPFIGPLVTLSRVPRAWCSGKTDLGGGRTLIVSPGIGMERGDAPRLRFLCPPEIVILHLSPS